jgi:hypothetical protein
VIQKSVMRNETAPVNQPSKKDLAPHAMEEDGLGSIQSAQQSGARDTHGNQESQRFSHGGKQRPVRIPETKARIQGILERNPSRIDPREAPTALISEPFPLPRPEPSPRPRAPSCRW